MSRLPPANSPAYAALRKLAGTSPPQVLPLTSAELWSVPKDSVKAVEKAAAQHGVGVKLLGSDWHYVFHVLPADTTMNDKQKALLENAKAAKATIGVAVVATSAPETVEYALTKGADVPAESQPAAKISVRLGDGRVFTLTRSRVDVKPDMCVWRGTVDGTETPVTIMWWPSGKMSGTIHGKGRFFSIRHMGGDMHAVVEISKERMPDEHEPGAGTDARR